MEIFDHDKGDYNMVDFTRFFDNIRKDAMDTGYNLLTKHGIKGMKEELGSKNPVKITKKLINFFIQYEEYEKCAVLKKLIEDYKNNKKEKNENKSLDTDKRRGKK